MLGGILAGIAAKALPSIVKGVGKVIKAVTSKPVIKMSAAAAAGAGIAKVTSGGSSMNLPVMSGGSLPPIAAAAATPAPTKPGGLPIGWKGPGGKLQAPWSDPRIPEYLKQFALDDAYLTPVYRAPRGYVVIKDAKGRPFAVNKAMAKAFGLWKPKRKPPISVSDWQAFKKAERVEKKLKKIAGPALRKRGYRAGGRTTATATATARTRKK